ncbi:MAG TPA: aromatic ring-hydroxylating dioxygenase subunit alpha [Myxococcaceae bacterium]|nr:aromatic ring-hydroxylating dioxygenase subunit alpha [Myxococcaceae bacterium]
MLDGFADEGIAEQWTPVALSREVGRHPYGLTLASERVVLFRDGQGQVAALHDRCPHRGVKLSLGKVEDGCLTCPFHGWRFGGDGANRHIPFNPLPEEKRQRYAATRFPVRERGGFIWLYTRPGAEAPEEPAVPEVLEQEGLSVWRYVETWRSHWTRAMENMLDSPHLPFIHRWTLGAGMRRRMKADSRMEIQVHPLPTGFRTTWTLDGGSSEAYLDWMRPNGMTLGVPVPKRTLRLHVWCVPVDANHTRMFVASARSFLRYNPLGWLFDQFNRRVIHEDRAVVESSDPAEVPPPAEEKSVATDRATLVFRRWYLEHKRGRTSEAASPEVQALTV